MVLSGSSFALRSSSLLPRRLVTSDAHGADYGVAVWAFVSLFIHPADAVGVGGGYVVVEDVDVGGPGVDVEGDPVGYLCGDAASMVLDLDAEDVGRFGVAAFVAGVRAPVEDDLERFAPVEDEDRKGQLADRFFRALCGLRVRDGDAGVGAVAVGHRRGRLEAFDGVPGRGECVGEAVAFVLDAGVVGRLADVTFRTGGVGVGDRGYDVIYLLLREAVRGAMHAYPRTEALEPFGDLRLARGDVVACCHT